MKNLSKAIILIALSTLLFPFRGDIEVNTTWDEDIIITGTTTIHSGATLTIMPGVTVYFTKVDSDGDNIGDTQFIIEGRLVCQGLLNDRVTFTSNQDIPQPADWAGIIYQTDDSGILTTISNTDILYANEGFLLNGKNVTFNKLRIANAALWGLNIQNTFATTSLNDVTIENCGTYGLYVGAGEVVFNEGVVANFLQR